MKAFNFLRNRADSFQQGNKSLAMETLALLSPEYSSAHFKVLNYSDASDSTQRDRVHLETNLLLRENLEKNSLGECIHITGRMSALSDPFHADLCTNIFRKTKNPFKFSYFDQDEPDTDAISVLKQKHIMWSGEGWKHSVSALRKEAQSQIEAYAVRKPTPVQYTVFGNKYIQLQSEHSDIGGASSSKHVWLIESKQVHDLLLTEAAKTLESAKHISPNLFREALNMVAGIASQAVLKKLSVIESLDLKIATEVASDFHEDPSNIIEALKEFDFVTYLDDDCLRISENGRNLLDQMS